MKKEYTLDELRQKAASYCAISEHCISEVEQKLFAWGVEKSQTEEIVNYLVENDFINEKRYSKAFVRDKFHLNKWGKIKISMALVSKNIPKQLISGALNLIDEGEYDEMLAALLKSKQKSIKFEFEFEKQGKLFRFAQSRGFENQVIERVIRKL